MPNFRLTVLAASVLEVLYRVSKGEDITVDKSVYQDEE